MQADFVTVAYTLSTGVWLTVGLYKITHRPKMIDVIRSHKIPCPRLAFWLSVSIELGGTLFMLLQFKVWIIVLVWLGFLCIATPIFHGIVVKNGSIDYPQLVQLAKNVSIAGGLVALLVIDGTVPRTVYWLERNARTIYYRSSILGPAASATETAP